MAETVVSKEVSKMVAIEEKCGLDTSSYQDLPKPDCNGTNHHNPANDFDNSYVFVSGDDVDSKDVDAGVSSILPASDAAEGKGQGAESDSQIEKNDAVGEELQPLNKVENGVIEHNNGAPPLAIFDNKDVEAESSSVLPESGATGVKEQGAELDSQIENVDAVSEELQPLNKVENRIIERSNGAPSVILDNKDVEAEDSSVLAESDATGVKEQGAEFDSQIENFDQQPLNEAENRNIEPSSGELLVVNDVEAEVSSVLPESGTDGVKDQGAELDSQIENIDAESLNETETRNIEQRDEGLPLESIDNKDRETEVLSVLPGSDAVGLKDPGEEQDSQFGKSDVGGGEFQPLDEAETRNVEQADRDLPLVNADNKDVEAEVLSVLPDSNPGGVEDQGAELDPQIEKLAAVGGEFHPQNEVESMSIKQSNGDLPLKIANSKDDVEAEVLSVPPESDPAGVEDQGAEMSFQDEKSDAVGGELQPLNEAETMNTEQTNEDLPSINVDNKDVEADVLSGIPESDPAGVNGQGEELDAKTENSAAVGGEFQPLSEVENGNIEAEGSYVLSESDATEVKDQGAEMYSQNEKFDPVSREFQALNEVENRSVERSSENPTSVNDSTSKLERSHKDDDENIEISAEAEFRQVQDPDVKIEISAGAEVENAMAQNEKVEVAAEVEEEKFNVIPESSLGPVENQDSQVIVSGLVAESGENRELDNVLLNSNRSHSANDESEDQSKLSVTEALEAYHGSQDMVVHVIEPEVQNVTIDAEDEVNSMKEIGDAAENEDSPSTSLDSDLESCPGHSKDKTLEEVTKTDVIENQQGDTPIGNNVHSLIGQMDKTVVSRSDFHVQNVCDPVEGKDEVCCVTEVDNGVPYAEEIGEQPEQSGVSCDTMPSETRTGASNAHAPQGAIGISESETVGAVSASHIGSPKSQIIEKVFPGEDSGISCLPEEASSVSGSTLDAVVLTEKEPDFQSDEAHAETSVSSGKAEVADSRPATDDDGVASCGTEVLDSSNVIKEAASIELDVEGTDDMRDQLNGSAGNSESNEISVASAGNSSANTSEESVKMKTKPFNFLIRVPRFDDENLREKIRLAKLHVDEKTKLREAVQSQIQEIRANSQIHGIDYEYAKTEARSARKLVRSKRMEIDSLQSVINKAKNALSIEDIDSQIYNMEHMIQHETLPLKEEKQLIRDIKQLKQLREQLSSNMGSQDEIKQAVEQRGEVEERLKILRKELDILKNKVSKAEATAAEAEKKYDDENKKVKELQARFRAADDVRQEAYAQWQNLRKELSKKSEHFFKYKDDAAVASNYAFSRDTEALYRLCTNQVEKFMELWNTNEEFRREYAKFNARSTVRRFGTLDGRPLGPDEEPPILPSYGNERTSRLASTPVKADLASQIEVKQETREEIVTLDSQSTKKETEPKYQKVTKTPAITVESSNGLDTLSHKELIYEEPPVKSREEIESLRREEEKRREEAESKLKEQRRLEALAKAHEARERKKRQAEKLQMRAELKTQKEAEQREKEREKRLRKKERKKAGVPDGNESSYNCETAPSSESTVENKDVEVKEMSTAGPKKPQKPWLFAKQSKTKTIPPPLRNRNKKKWQQWMWVGFTSIIIVVLFWLGNIGVFSNVALKRRGPIH